MRKLDLKKIILIVLLVFVGGFLRFFKLSDYPIQLNHDEISQLYDLMSVMQTGKDVYGNFLPLAFPSTGDYKVGHYIYISAIPYLIFQSDEITIRIAAAFFGTLTILAVFLFINVLTKNWILAFISAIFIAVTPSEIFYSRKSFENVIGVSLVFLGLFCLLKSVDEKKKFWAVCGIFFTTSAMYVYTSHTMVVPLLLLLFIFLFREKLKFNLKKFALLFFGWLILILPLILMTVSNPELSFRASSVFITQDVNLGRLISLSWNPIKTYIDYIFARYLDQFNPVYIFANGLEFTNQGFLGVGPLYLWQLPFCVLGIIYIFKSKYFIQTKLLFGIVALGMIPSALTFEPFSPHRSMLGFSGLSIISAFGVYWFISLILKASINIKLKTALFVFFSALLVFNFLYFLHMYIINYPFEKSHKLQYPFKQVAQFAWSQYQNFDEIVFDPQFGDFAPIIGVGAHYYLAYYGDYPPAKFQNEYRVGKKPREVIFDKFSIRQVYWPEDKDLKNTLVIASIWSVPINEIDKSKIIKRFNFYNGRGAFYAIKL